MLREKLNDAVLRKPATGNSDVENRPYPASTPFNKGSIRVGGYTLPYEEFGNPDGIPIVYLHGGPGGGTSPNAHRFFDPKAFRIITYDQRGAGKSTPYGGVKDNSPDLLVEDLDKLRKHLNIDKWHVHGGSWGSTLALLYAEAHPNTVSSLFIGGVFTMRAQENDWFVNDMGKFFPESRKEFVEFLPEAERGNLLESYYQRLISPDPAIHLPAARVWSRYETSCAHLTRPDDKVLDQITGEASLAIARIEAHFFRNHAFTPDDRILRDLHKISHIPTVIIQGRHDVICPPETAFAVAEKLANCQLTLMPYGHSIYEPETLKAIVATTNRIRDTGSPVSRAAAAQAPKKGPRL